MARPAEKAGSSPRHLAPGLASGPRAHGVLRAGPRRLARIAVTSTVSRLSPNPETRCGSAAIPSADPSSCHPPWGARDAVGVPGKGRPPRVARGIARDRRVLPRRESRPTRNAATTRRPRRTHPWRGAGWVEAGRSRLESPPHTPAQPGRAPTGAATAAGRRRRAPPRRTRPVPRQANQSTWISWEQHSTRCASNKNSHHQSELCSDDLVNRGAGLSGNSDRCASRMITRASAPCSA